MKVQSVAETPCTNQLAESSAPADPIPSPRLVHNTATLSQSSGQPPSGEAKKPALGKATSSKAGTMETRRGAAERRTKMVGRNKEDSRHHTTDGATEGLVDTAVQSKEAPNAVFAYSP
jgi:hypothetical protein